MSYLRPDPAFALQFGPGLRLQGPVSGREAARLLAQCVHRRPQDLRAHVLRVQLLIAAGSRKRLFGALVDVYIALSGSGLALRERLLRAAQTQLTQPQLELLCEYRDKPLSSRQPLKGLRGSVLCEGFEGRAELVGEQREEAGFNSVLDEAVSCIEYGQLDEAREMLEAALLENPSDAAICTELVNLYGYLDDEMLIVDFCSRFIECGEEPPEVIADLLGLD